MYVTQTDRDAAFTPKALRMLATLYSREFVAFRFITALEGAGLISVALLCGNSYHFLHGRTNH